MSIRLIIPIRLIRTVNKGRKSDVYTYKKNSLPGFLLKDCCTKKAATYSPALRCSTIGAPGLNFSVRDGKRWNPRAIATWLSLSCPLYWNILFWHTPREPYDDWLPEGKEKTLHDRTQDGYFHMTTCKQLTKAQDKCHSMAKLTGN